MPTHEQVITDLTERLAAAEAVIDRYRRDVGQLVEERTTAEARVAALEAEWTALADTQAEPPALAALRAYLDTIEAATQTGTWVPYDAVSAALDASDLLRARVAALTAAERAVLPVCYDEETDGMIVATVCRSCMSFEPTQHSEGCPVGSMTALLTEATPSTTAGAGEGAAFEPLDDHPGEHGRLLRLMRRHAADYAPYGHAEREWGDCSCGCRWYRKLSGELGMDWGVCTNTASHRVGLLTFEHQGCPQFEREPDLEEGA
jgi:hypothetical protein